MRAEGQGDGQEVGERESEGADWISRGIERRLVLRQNQALDLDKESEKMDSGGFKAGLMRLHQDLSGKTGGRSSLDL